MNKGSKATRHREGTQGRWNHQGVGPASGQNHPMIRNVLVMAKSGVVLFSKEFVNPVAQVRGWLMLKTKKTHPTCWHQARREAVENLHRFAGYF